MSIEHAAFTLTVDGRRVAIPLESLNSDAPLAGVLSSALRPQGGAGFSHDTVVRLDGEPTAAGLRIGDVQDRQVDTTTDAMPSLVHCSGLHAGLRHLLPAGSQVLGRGMDATIRVRRSIVSRKHCQIDVRDGHVEVTDLRSKNGTRIAGRPVGGPTRLEPGDVLDAGGELFRLYPPRSVDSALLGHLFQQAISDSITGARSRRYTEACLAEELAPGVGWGPLSVVLIDLDHFKPVNDSHGHPAGDQVLAECARRIQANLPESALLGRWGGDEFMVVLSGMDPQSAEELAQRFCSSIAQVPIRTVSQQSDILVELRQTVSIGVTGVVGSPIAMKELIETADKALYLAKNGGKNQVATKLVDSIVEQALSSTLPGTETTRRQRINATTASREAAGT